MNINTKYIISQLLCKYYVIATAFFLLLHLNGEPINVNGISISNFFVVLFILISISKDKFIIDIVKIYFLPITLILTTILFPLIGGKGAQLSHAFQSLAFLIFPYFLHKNGLSKTLFNNSFIFVFVSQIWLLLNNNFTLPPEDLGGFFVSRRTVHGLALGAFATLFVSNLRQEKWRLFFFLVIFSLLLISQSRGAAIAFFVGFLAFGGDFLSARSRRYAAALSAMVVALTLLWQSDLLNSYYALFSTTGGSSTEYRLYLLDILINEFGNYWLSGLPEEEIQYIFAQTFSEGRMDQRFALDNSFTHMALRYGIFPMTILLLISKRMIFFRKSYTFFIFAWLMLDDILGNALGWLLLGQAMLAPLWGADEASGKRGALSRRLIITKP